MNFTLPGSLLIGSIPGILIGSVPAMRVAGGSFRPFPAIVPVANGLKMLLS